MSRTAGGRSEALASARNVAGGKDVRIGGGATVVRDFLRAVAAEGPVLEYGCGNGRILLPIARHGVEVVGVERHLLNDIDE